MKNLSTDTETKQLYNVEIYNGRSLMGLVTVTAKSPEDASNIAVQDINVKIKRAW